MPRKLAKLLVQGQQRHPKTKTVFAAATALHLFLEVALKHHSMLAGKPLAHSALQQLKEAGLMQHLSALLMDAAEGLEAAAAAPDTELSSSRLWPASTRSML